jgi:ubiquinone/menaquinone biosynthesis C-methylase UbiE
MKKEGFYEQNRIPQEEIERLERIEYPNFVSETILNPIDLNHKRILDSGAGPNAKLAEFVAHKGGMYVPLDIRTDVLKQMRDKTELDKLSFYGVQGDVRDLPFGDKTFDLIHQRFVLMNIARESRGQALKELLRVGKEKLVLLEYNWRTLGSTESRKTIERFRELAFAFFSRFSTDPYMGEQFEDLLSSTDPHLKYSLQRFDRKEDVAHSAELILNLKGMYQGAKDVLKDEDLAGEFKKLSEEIEESPIAFTPPQVVAAIVELT